MARSAEGSIVFTTVKWDSTPVRKRGESRHIHEIQTHGENMEGKVRKTVRDFLWRSEVKVYLHA